ncbi:MAG: DEAD/DEAH box helicase [Candidatus Aramenus sulfurataquae]|jgi:helicase|uniref:DEAD/DEAH box helicase n=2 Tax=Candidatus Aramenus sulfurataquae TaxID=1326980 RepID=W7KP73_9CREN|nr:MAG: DEAD/DEAH box helicase [Candidatus Aramenus sulfurataquae]
MDLPKVIKKPSPNNLELNDFQQKFLEAYNSNPMKNYLLSAPTGSGKTYLAKYVLENRERIAVYVSPLKALAKEVYEEVKEKRKAKYVDSEVYEDDLGKFNADVLLSTYEKFDSAIRHQYKWLKEVSVVLIDEVHNVESDRGMAIENIVLWAKNNDVPLISLSATLPNLEEYRKWLNAEVISQDKRAVPLHECVAYPFVLRCYDNDFNLPLNSFAHVRNAKLQVLLSVMEYIKNLGKNALIFVRSRKSTEALRDTLLKFGFKVERYHSGLPPEEKKRIIDALKNGDVNFLVTTTALGQGVNLPVFATVFYDIYLPSTGEKGEFKGWRELDLMEFKQIAGRAGRPKYDKEGMAIIVASSIREADEMRSKFFSNSYQTKLTSYKVENLSIGVISWAEGIEEKEFSELIKGSLKFKGIREEEVAQVLERVTNLNLVKRDSGLYLTSLGRAVSWSYIDVDSLASFPISQESFDVLDAVANSSAVVQSLRGCKEGKELLRRWIQGESISDLCRGLSAKDINEVIDNARWISFALYRVLKALGKDYEKAYKVYVQMKYGVPMEVVKLAQLGLDRETALKLKDVAKDDLDLCVKAGLPQIKQVLKERGYTAEGLCRKYYSTYPEVFDMMRALEKFYGKEFEFKELASRYGKDVFYELVKKGYIAKAGSGKYVVNFP